MSQFKLYNQRSVKLGQFIITTPTLFIGHDLDHQVKIWQRLPECPGIMVNAYQLFMMPIIRARAAKYGLHSLLGYTGPIFLDSGGFLFQRDGKTKITASELLALYEQLGPDIAAILDVPLNPLVSVYENTQRWRSTLANTDFMYRNNGSLFLAPVFHAYQINDIPERYAQLSQIIPNPPFICVGSLVPLLKGSYIGSIYNNPDHLLSPALQRWQFITRLMLKIRCLYPTSIIHVFGVGSLSTMYLLFLLGVDSVDSLSWRLKAAYGEIQLPGLSDRSINPRTSTTRVRRSLQTKELDLLLECKCPYCEYFSIEEKIKILSSSFTARATHNAFVFLSELESIRHALRVGELCQFVRNRFEESSFFRKVVDSVIYPELEKTLTDNQSYMEEA